MEPSCPGDSKAIDESQHFAASSSDILAVPALTYTSLPFQDSIRVIEIHSDRSSEFITCSLRPIRLSDHPSYEAVSYTWGDPTDRRNIFIRSESQLYRLSVTANCEEALRKLQPETGSRVVWLDAICIDQSNIPERNQQVGMMRDIYRDARRVVIYVGKEQEPTHKDAHAMFLGNGSAGSDEALYFLEHCQDDDAYGTEIGMILRNTIVSFFERPWFSRIWMLQEVYMAQTAIVVCGAQQAPWSIIRPRRIWIEPYMEKEWWHPTLPFSIPPVLEIGSHHNGSYTAHKDFLTLLYRNRACQATDSRDKVFALLGMVADAKENGMVADYRKCPAQVFTETTSWLLQNVGLSVLSCIQGPPSTPGVPSWAVDWGDSLSGDKVMGLGLGYPLKAAGATTCAIEILHHAGTAHTHESKCSYGHYGADCSGIKRLLKVRGIQFDTIRSVLPARYQTGWEGKNKKEDEFIAEIESYMPNMAPPPATDSDRRLVPDDWHYRHIPPPDRDGREHQWSEWIEEDQTSQVHTFNGRKLMKRERKTNEPMLELPVWATHRYGLPFQWDSDSTDNDVKERFMRMYEHRNLISTQKGYFGIAPNEAKDGDLVCILLGGATPFILREEQSYEGNRYFRFIGESYVYWIMEGEALIPEERMEDLVDFLIL